MNNLVIFDLDGTLLDTLGDLTDSVNFAIASVGHDPRTLDEMRTFIGNGTRRMIERALGEDALNKETVDDCVSEFAAHYNDHYNVKTEAYKGIELCISELVKNGIRIGVVTNKLHDISVKLCFEHFGDVFDGVIGDLPGLERKPDPSKVLKMMSELDCGSAIMVGDSDVDVMTAKNAGIPCVAVSWGFNSREKLIAAHPEYIVDSAEELERKLLEILKIVD